MSIALREGIVGQSVQESLEDLLVRFVINSEDEDLSSIERVFFQIEEAHWFYIDHIRALNQKLPSMKIKLFSKQIIDICPVIWKWGDPSDAYSRFSKYKSTIPVRGIALFNETLTKILLVQGVESSSWSFPRGKISKDEDDSICAVRECKEETGFDATDLIDPEKYVERTIKGKNYKIFLVKNVPEDFEFKPVVKFEINEIKWKSWKKITKECRNGTNSYYLLNSLFKPIDSWVNKQKGVYDEEVLKKYAESQMKILLGIGESTKHFQTSKRQMDAGREILDFLHSKNVQQENIIDNNNIMSNGNIPSQLNQNTLPQFFLQLLNPGQSGSPPHNMFPNHYHQPQQQQQQHSQHLESDFQGSPYSVLMRQQQQSPMSAGPMIAHSPLPNYMPITLANNFQHPDKFPLISSRTASGNYESQNIPINNLFQQKNSIEQEARKNNNTNNSDNLIISILKSNGHETTHYASPKGEGSLPNYEKESFTKEEKIKENSSKGIISQIYGNSKPDDNEDSKLNSSIELLSLFKKQTSPGLSPSPLLAALNKKPTAPANLLAADSNKNELLSILRKQKTQPEEKKEDSIPAPVSNTSRRVSLFGNNTKPTDLLSMLEKKSNNSFEQDNYLSILNKKKQTANFQPEVNPSNDILSIINNKKQHAASTAITTTAASPNDILNILNSKKQPLSSEASNSFLNILNKKEQPSNDASSSLLNVLNSKKHETLEASNGLLNILNKKDQDQDNFMRRFSKEVSEIHQPSAAASKEVLNLLNGKKAIDDDQTHNNYSRNSSVLQPESLYSTSSHDYKEQSSSTNDIMKLLYQNNNNSNSDRGVSNQTQDDTDSAGMLSLLKNSSKRYQTPSPGPMSSSSNTASSYNDSPGSANDNRSGNDFLNILNRDSLSTQQLNDQSPIAQGTSLNPQKLKNDLLSILHGRMF